MGKSNRVAPLIAALAVACTASALGADLRAERATQDGVEVVHLTDAKRGMDVEIVPSLGNRAIAFLVHGRNILFASQDVKSAGTKARLDGVPFLAPWANRLDENGYWVGDAHYELNASLKNYGTDNNGLPMHGLLTASPLWKVTNIGSKAGAAYVTSTLEFWRDPQLMEQWPFAQTYEMTYRLHDGQLDVQTTIKNLSQAALPVSIGFHPYYTIPDVPREEWTLRLPASQRVNADAHLIPTGETRPNDLPETVDLKGRVFDDGFTGLRPSPDGKVHFIIASGSKQIELIFGPKYPVAVVWEPVFNGHPTPFMCVEPMAGLTDAINLHHAGKYPQLQMVAPGETWSETFSIRPSGL